MGRILISNSNFITSEIWAILNLLRGKLPLNDFHITLFILSLYKDDYFNDVNKNDEGIWKAVEEKLNDSTYKNSSLYLTIYSILDNSLHQLNDTDLHSFLKFLKNINSDQLKSEFANIFDQLLYQLASSQGRNGGEYLQPAELTDFILGLTDLPDDGTVFNPFAGVASFAIHLQDNQRYFGQEKNNITWAIGMLRILAYQKITICSYLKDDSLSQWPNTNQHFDLIVSNPPFGLKLDHNLVRSPFRTIEPFLIEKGIQLLSQRGKLIAVLPTGFLFRGTIEQDLRRQLIEADLVETIISLPGGLLWNVAMPIIVLVINKSKSNSGFVKFVDGKSYVQSVKSGGTLLNHVELLAIIKSGLDSDSLRNISNEQIRASDYNLNVSRYFQKSVEGTSLSEILNRVYGSRIAPNTIGRVVRIRDLKDDRFNYLLDEESIENDKVDNSVINQFRLITESVLLIASRWNTLKPTYFDYKGTPVCIPKDIFAFKINEQIAHEPYLINELNADYVQEQLNSFRIGSVMPQIKTDDLLKVKIKLPTPKEQIAKMQGIKELSYKIDALQQERDALILDRSSVQFSEFSSLKHTLGRPRQNILDWSINLIDFINKHEQKFEQLNDEFEDFYSVNMVSAIQVIKREVNFITETLEKGEKGLLVEDYPLELVPLSKIYEFLNEFTGNGFKVIKILPNEKVELSKRGIELNINLLKVLIDNILTNAEKHGFTEMNPSNEVIIELKTGEDKLILEIKNNGKPFPKNFDKEKFITKYSTMNAHTGTGIGGYDINRIAKYFHNQEWDLILNEDPIYPVIFIFEFPLKLVK